MNLIRIKISNCERVALTIEDHFLIKEISDVGASLCGSVYTFQWSNEIEGIYKERTSLVIKSVQEQAAAFILEQLITLNSVKDFIEILFYDMTARERMVEESYKRDTDEILYMEQARKSIGDILATYIALNENYKYRVLEFCKIGVIFNEKIFNVTYLQDIMNRASTTLFAIELSKYMKRSALEFKMTQEQVQERTVYISWGDYCETGSRNLKKILVLITCRCIYLLNPCTSPPCPLCGEERFCPKPPTYNTHIEFSSITKIISFSKFNQGMALEYKQDNNMKGFVFISKNYDGGKNMVDTLISIKEEFTHSTMDEEDLITENMPIYVDCALRNSLENLLSTNDRGKSVLNIYCSLNPETSLIGFMEGLRIFKRGVLVVVTDKDYVIALEVNFKNWSFTQETEDTHINFINQALFSAKNEFNLGKCNGAAIKDEAECKFHLKIENSKNVFYFGDDYTLEVFQRCVFPALYRLKGGQKVKRRVVKEKKDGKKN